MGNEDMVYNEAGTKYRTCLLTQPHDLQTGNWGGQNTVDNMRPPNRASQVVRYPMDYKTMEFILNDYVTNLGNSLTADNQRFLLDCKATYRITSMSNVPFEVDVIRWYVGRGIPQVNNLTTSNATANIINFLGYAAADQGQDQGNPHACNVLLYNCETVDTIVSSRNRVVRNFGIKLKKKRYLLHPGASVESIIRIKERIFNIYPWWNSTNAGTTIGSGSNRNYYIPPGSRGIIWCVRQGDAGTTAVANVNLSSYQSDSNAAYSIATFSTHYQVKYGLRHIPENPKAMVFITDSGIAPNLRSTAGGNAVLEATDDTTTGVKSAI